MGNRITDQEIIDFETRCELWDYVDYVEECVSGGELPLILQEWGLLNDKGKPK